MNMLVDLKEKRFVELKGLWELLSQMPHTLQELSKHRGDFLRVTVQMATPSPRREHMLLKMPLKDVHYLGIANVKTQH